MELLLDEEGQGLRKPHTRDSMPEFYSDIDLHFARLMQQLSGSKSPEIMAASALVSRYTRQGHICIDLNSYAGRSLGEGDFAGLNLPCPQLREWRDILAASPVVGSPGEYKPMILDAKSRLYLWRYWNYEFGLARTLLGMGGKEMPCDVSFIRESMPRYFPEAEAGGKINWQKVAVLMTLKGCLSIITGGPGTGKTTVVSRALAMLSAQSPKLKVALAAPTGKAAQRLEESLGKTFRSLDASGESFSAMSFRASTIHRLLGMVPGRSRAMFSHTNPLPYDIVVVDEASMTPLSLIARLVRALKPGTRLILVGDRNQLASVEPGHVLGDICDTVGGYGYSGKTCSLVREALGYEMTPAKAHGIADCIVELKDTYRFSEDSGIRKLGEAVRLGDDRCLDMVKESRFSDVFVRDLRGEGSLSQVLSPSVIEGYYPCLSASGPEERFMRFGEFRVLCGLREGPFGVVTVNRLIEKILSEKGLIRPDRQFYHGRPVLITANDYALRLFNGDIGIILHDEEEGDLKCFFQGTGGQVRRISCLRLPEHETAYAMTVHKSQGSEFDKVVLLLPRKDSPVLTRELIYTGITRARQRLDLWTTPEVFSAAVKRRTERTSGLYDLLMDQE